MSWLRPLRRNETKPFRVASPPGEVHRVPTALRFAGTHRSSWRVRCPRRLLARPSIPKFVLFRLSCWSSAPAPPFHVPTQFELRPAECGSIRLGAACNRALQPPAASRRDTFGQAFQRVNDKFLFIPHERRNARRGNPRQAYNSGALNIVRSFCFSGLCHASSHRHACVSSCAPGGQKSGGRFSTASPRRSTADLRMAAARHCPCSESSNAPTRTPNSLDSYRSPSDTRCALPRSPAAARKARNRS